MLSTKIEIRLAKAEAINWTSLEYGKNTLPPIINRPIGEMTIYLVYPFCDSVRIQLQGMGLESDAGSVRL